MNILRKLFDKKNKTLIIAAEDDNFRGIVAESSGICTEHYFKSGTDLKKIMEFGKQQKASQVLLLETADVRELELKLGSDLSEEERRSAIAYAAASSLGDHSGTSRISYMDGMFHDFRSGILVSYFDTEEIISAAKIAKSMKMKFLGITNFKQLLLSLHFSEIEHHGDAFLFLLGSHGVAAVPERNRLVIRNLPFGIPEKGAETEWLERVQRRLNTVFCNKRVCLYSPEADAEFSSMLQNACEAEIIEQMKWDEAVADGALFFLKSGHKLIHPALPPPKEKDPKASGTYLGLFFIAATLLSLGFLAARNAFTEYIFNRDIEAAQKLIDTVKQEKDTLKNLEKELLGQQEVFSVLKQKERVSKNYLLVLNLLSRYPLQYSRITSISEKNNGIHIEGESIYQVDLSRFFAHFENELSKYDLTLFSDGLSKEKDGRIIFRSHIAEAGDNKK